MLDLYWADVMYVYMHFKSYGLAFMTLPCTYIPFHCPSVSANMFTLYISSRMGLCTYGHKFFSLIRDSNQTPPNFKSDSRQEMHNGHKNYCIWLRKHVAFAVNKTVVNYNKIETNPIMVVLIFVEVFEALILKTLIQKFIELIVEITDVAYLIFYVCKQIKNN